MKNLKKATSTFTILLVVWVGHFIVDAMIGFWSVYKTLAHLDLALAGIIAGLAPFIGEGLQMVFGSLGDKGYRKTLLIFGVGAASANAFLPYTSSYSLFFLLFLLTCIGSGAFHPTGVAITSSLTKHRKGFFVTIFASGGALGLAFSHFIFSTGYTYLNCNTCYLVLPTIILISCLAFNKLSLTGPAQSGKRYGFSALRKFFQCRELTLLYISQVCNQAVYWGCMFLLPDVLSAKGYEPWISLGAGHFFYIFGGAIMMIPGGLLSDKYSPKLVLLISGVLGMLGFYIFLFAPLMSNFLLLLLLFTLGACLGVGNPVAVAYGNRIMPSRPGLVSAFLMGLVWCLAEAIGPGGGGLLTMCFADDAPIKALAFLGILFLAGIGTIALLPKEITKVFELERA